MELGDLKKAYGELAGKYELPEFSQVNESFEIDRVERDTDFILREIRKTMMDKIIGYIRFLEMMINPSQAPPMFMMFVRNIGPKDREVLEKVYKSFIELELRSLKLEVDYKESGEADAIKEIYSVWDKMRVDLRSTIEIMEKNWNGTSAEKKDKGYFG